MNLAAPRNLSRLLRLAAIGGAGILTLTMLVMGWHLAARFDAEARVNAQRLVDMGIAALEGRNEVTTADYANWTDAWLAVNRGDLAWLAANIGSGAAEDGAMDAVLLAGGPLRAPLGWTHAAQAAAFAQGRDDLAEQAQQLVARMGHSPGDPPVSAWARTGDALWLLTTAWVLPHDESMRADESPALLVVLKRMDQDDAEVLSEMVLIDGLRLTLAAPAAGDSTALGGVDGPAGFLAWQPPRPGRATLAGFALPMALALTLTMVAVGLGVFAASRLAARLERALRMSEAADRAKAELIATLSHELRTPMNGIVGMLDVLSTTELTHEQGECVRIALEAAETQVQMIERLLRFGQIEAGGAVLTAAPFQPAALLDEVVALSRPAAEAKGLSLTLTTQGPADRPLLGDRLAIRQIAVNLIGNAVKFTDAGAVRVQLSVVPGRGVHRLQLKVQDTGPGIAPADRDRIFASFVQTGSAASRRHGGVGLGLAISRGLAQAMGGVLSLVADSGPGTTFVFTVPLDPAGTDSARAASAA